jgi:adenylosuccinate lyase
MTHITESKFYGKRFTTPETQLIFADETRYQRWLNIEAALALVQGELGVIPIEAAEEIAQKAKLENLDLERVKIDLELTSHSLVPLLREVQRVCRGGLGEYIHYGATTQDILCTVITCIFYSKTII